MMTSVIPSHRLACGNPVRTRRHGRAAVARSSVPRKRLGYLAGEPSCGGMLADGRVNDPPTVVGKNDHHVKQPKRRNDTDATTNISIAAMLAA